MSTIIVYKRLGTNATIGLTPAERREGMKDAGQQLRTLLSQSGGAANESDAEDRVRDVLDWLIDKKSTILVGASTVTVNDYDVRFEVSRTATIQYKIEGQTDRRGRYWLTHPSNVGNSSPDPTLNGKLRLDIGLDDRSAAKSIFRMKLTVPRAASDSTSWDYLSADINADLVQIGSSPVTPVQNYLISTFMFSRCR